MNESTYRLQNYAPAPCT